MATQTNSLKFLNHLWNVQNIYLNSPKKISKTTISIKENKYKSTVIKKSILFPEDGNLNSNNIKTRLKLIDLIKLLYKLKEFKYFNSIR